MGYRDELGAAQARADAASRELEAEKEARGDDATRIAELERSLAASLQELATLREASEPEYAQPTVGGNAVQGTRDSKLVGVAAFVCMSLVGVVGYFSILGSDSMSPPVGGGYEIFAPADPEFDMSDQLEVARRAATRHFEGEFLSGPYLRMMEANAVDDAGKNHMQFGSVSYDFTVELQPMALEQDDRPVGTRGEQVDERHCFIRIRVDSEGIKYPSEFTASIDSIGILRRNCEGPGLQPRCSVSEIRRRSLADGAPKGAMAQVRIREGGQWHVGIEDQGKTLFSSTYKDDCAP